MNYYIKNSANKVPFFILTALLSGICSLYLRCHTEEPGVLRIAWICRAEKDLNTRTISGNPARFGDPFGRVSGNSSRIDAMYGRA
jgi:hypothetical protein